jgi:hypothetical protein
MSNVILVVALLFASQDAAGQRRIRVTDAKIAALIQLGLEKSVTFRGLVEEIEAGDVIVHVDRENFLPGRLGGRMRLTGRAGTRRYVRVTIDAELQPRQFVASLAHELHHVSELVANPDVDDDASLEALYLRIGSEHRVNGQTAFETEAARRVGMDVQRELLVPQDSERRITITAKNTRGARER